MKKIYFIILDLLCIKFLSSQNLAPNPGFETTSPSCPTASDQLLKAIPWDRGWITPDAFNTCGPTPLTAYTSATGGSQITANTGTGMMGMFCYHSNGNEIEYATVQLASPMLANTQYTVSFYARVANLARFKFTIDRIGCYFTSTSSSSVNYNGGGATPQVQTPAGSYFSTNWTQYIMTFTTPISGAALQYMTIGNFRSPAATSAAVLTSTAASTSNSAYIFFDDFVVTSAIILPIELIDFTANCLDNNNTVQLNWRTASEKNNKEFIIERSRDGINFEPINRVLGNGNSLIINSYQIIDDDFNYGLNETVYYRLKQVDYDGKINYSKIISVNDCNIKTNNFEIYPNPTDGILYINNITKLKNIEILNSLGQVVVSETIDNNKNSIDLSKLSNGLYFLKAVVLNYKIIKIKFVKY